MEVNDKIKLANNLKEDIRSLEYFTDNISSRLPAHNSGARLEITEVRRVKIFGWFWFGCGEHEKSFDIPASVLGDIHQIAVKTLRKKKEQLDGMWK